MVVRWICDAQKILLIPILKANDFGRIRAIIKNESSRNKGKFAKYFKFAAFE